MQDVTAHRAALEELFAPMQTEPPKKVVEKPRSAGPVCEYCNSMISQGQREIYLLKENYESLLVELKLPSDTALASYRGVPLKVV